MLELQTQPCLVHTAMPNNFETFGRTVGVAVSVSPNSLDSNVGGDYFTPACSAHNRNTKPSAGTNFSSPCAYLSRARSEKTAGGSFSPTRSLRQIKAAYSSRISPKCSVGRAGISLPRLVNTFPATPHPITVGIRSQDRRTTAGFQFVGGIDTSIHWSLGAPFRVWRAGVFNSMKSHD